MEDKEKRMLKVAIIIGSTRSHRLGERVAQWVELASKEMKDWDVTVLDLKKINLPFYDEISVPAEMDRKYPNPKVQAWSKAIEEAEAFLIITPEYNHSVPAPLKNAIDWLYPEWSNKPAALVGYSTSSTGGARAIEHLRNILATLAVATVRTGLTIGRAQDIIDEKGACKDENLNKVLRTEFAQLDSWGKAMSSLHKKK